MGLGCSKNWMVVSNIFIFTPTWGNDPISLIFFKGVETTNQKSIKMDVGEGWSHTKAKGISILLPIIPDRLPPIYDLFSI